MLKLQLQYDAFARTDTMNVILYNAYAVKKKCDLFFCFVLKYVSGELMHEVIIALRKSFNFRVVFAFEEVLQDFCTNE